MVLNMRLFDDAGGAVLLGFQHFILFLGTAVMIPTLLVPLMGGNAVRVRSLFNFVAVKPYLLVFILKQTTPSYSNFRLFSLF
jgi:hypothetical protein